MYSADSSRSHRATARTVSAHTIYNVKKTKRVVYLENAASGQKYTSHSRAVEYVRQGRAEWLSPKMDRIRFVSDDVRHLVVQQRIYQEQMGPMATRRMIQRIPVVGNITVLTTRRRPVAEVR